VPGEIYYIQIIVKQCVTKYCCDPGGVCNCDSAYNINQCNTYVHKSHVAYYYTRSRVILMLNSRIVNFNVKLNLWTVGYHNYQNLWLLTDIYCFMVTSILFICH